MTGIRNLLIGVALIAPAAALGGCYAETSAYEVDAAPPAAREEVVVNRPGYIWVHGRWARTADHHWAWRGGYYERNRPGYAYTEGRWERRGQAHVWVDGGWRARATVTER